MQVLINSCKAPVAKPTGENAVKEFYFSATDTVLKKLDLLAAATTADDSVKMRQYFLESRIAYKTTEAVTEYFFQGLNKRINGPALPDVRVDDGIVWPPHGFQVLEQLIWEAPDSSRQKLITEINVLKTDLMFTKTNLSAMAILPHHLQELIQHQIIRIATISLPGTDVPLCGNNFPEMQSSLSSLKTLALFRDNTKPVTFIDSTINYLEHHGNEENFDAMYFIRKYLMPLSDSIALALKEDTTLNKPFYGGLSSLLKGKSFNSDYFANYSIAGSNAAKVELGKKLFYEKLLSGSQSMSCASCHKPELHFTDGEAKAKNFVHGGNLARNSPTLLYAGFQKRQFFDMRSATLEDQVNEVMNSTEEFNLSANDAVQKITQRREYKALVQKAFNGADTINSFYIRNAIAAYIRSLPKFNSPFDRYMNGEDSALSRQQIQGFNLFMTKAKCGTCHFMPLFNGTIPPFYSNSESEVIGVPRQPVFKNAVIDSDSGRYLINPFAELLFAFKTPTVRNAAFTGPYMHNGVFKTLDQVIEFYDEGGGNGTGMNLENQTLPSDKLQLKQEETQALIAFIKGLSDGDYTK